MPVFPCGIGVNAAGLGDPPPAERGKARIRPGPVRYLDRCFAAIGPGDKDRQIVGRRNLDIGAQPVEAQALDEIVSHAGRQVEQKSLVGLAVLRLRMDQEIEEDLALRRQQPAIGNAGRRQACHIGGDDILQEGRGVAAGNAHDGAIIKAGAVHPCSAPRFSATGWHQAETDAAVTRRCGCPHDVHL